VEAAEDEIVAAADSTDAMRLLRTPSSSSSVSAVEVDVVSSEHVGSLSRSWSS
jgi:hypothetical protein